MTINNIVWEIQSRITLKDQEVTTLFGKMKDKLITKKISQKCTKYGEKIGQPKVWYICDKLIFFNTNHLVQYVTDGKFKRDK